SGLVCRRVVCRSPVSPTKNSPAAHRNSGAIVLMKGCPWTALCASAACVLEERLQACLRATQDQSMDVVGAFIGVHDFQVDQVAGYAELVRNTVAAQHVAGQAGDVQRLAARVTFHD